MLQYEVILTSPVVNLFCASFVIWSMHCLLKDKMGTYVNEWLALFAKEKAFIT